MQLHANVNHLATETLTTTSTTNVVVVEVVVVVVVLIMIILIFIIVIINAIINDSNIFIRLLIVVFRTQHCNLHAHILMSAICW